MTRGRHSLGECARHTIQERSGDDQVPDEKEELPSPDERSPWSCVNC
jgi:hypothetical protein